jgi:hypothetical protein
VRSRSWHGAAADEKRGNGTMNGDHIRQEVKAAYEAYLEAFRSANLQKIDSLVKYPLASVEDGMVRMLDRFPVNPSELMAKKGWHSTIDGDYDVVGISPTKAHVVLRNAQRLRKDGSLIETVSAFYAFTRTATGWKIFAISGIVISGA